MPDPSASLRRNRFPPYATKVKGSGRERRHKLAKVARGCASASLVTVTLLISCLHARARQVSIFDHGAKCNGNGANAEVDTSAAEDIASAGDDIYLPANNYCIFTRPITLHRYGQRIFGDGPAASKILIYTVFASDKHNDFGKGVLNLEAPGQEIRGIAISFKQLMNPKSRGDLVTYQPAIRARQPGTKLADLRIVGATTCIDMGGGTNAGHSTLSSIDTGCFDFGLRFDGALDTVAIHHHHSFPFEMSAAQASIFQRPDNIAIDLGRVDDFAIDGGSLCLGQTCINLFQGTGGAAFGTVTNYDFDGAATGIRMTASTASLSGSALTFSAGTSAQHAIVQSAGRLIISGSSFYAQASTVLDYFSGGIQTITGSLWNTGSFDATAILGDAAQRSNSPAPNGSTISPSRLTLVGNAIERDSAATFATPWLQSRGNEIIVGGQNSVTPTTHGGLFVSVAHDQAANHWIGNSSPGWTSLLAGSRMPDSAASPFALGKYFGN